MVETKVGAMAGTRVAVRVFWMAVATVVELDNGLVVKKVPERADATAEQMARETAEQMADEKAILRVDTTDI